MSLAALGLGILQNADKGLAGAVGAGGMAGLKQMSKSREDYDTAKLALLGMRQKIDAARSSRETKRTKASRDYYNDLIDDTRARLNNLYSDARSYRTFVEDDMGVKSVLKDVTPPGLKAEITALEQQLKVLNAARRGVSFDASTPIASAAN